MNTGVWQCTRRSVCLWQCSQDCGPATEAGGGLFRRYIASSCFLSQTPTSTREEKYSMRGGNLETLQEFTVPQEPKWYHNEFEIIFFRGREQSCAQSMKD